MVLDWVFFTDYKGGVNFQCEFEKQFELTDYKGVERLDSVASVDVDLICSDMLHGVTDAWPAAHIDVASDHLAGVAGSLYRHPLPDPSWGGPGLVTHSILFC